MARIYLFRGLPHLLYLHDIIFVVFLKYHIISGVSFLLLYIISMLYIVAIYLWFWCGKQNDRPYVILAMPFNPILSSSHLYYRNTQCFLWQCQLP